MTKLTLKNFCTDHNDKMEGMISLSTSCLSNTFCMAHRNIDGAICKKCYAHAMAQRFGGSNGNFEKKLIRNSELLKKHDLKLEDMPILNTLLVRLEAFRDIDCTLQVKNYFTLCKANPFITFALWTKNPSIIEKAINEYGLKKPDNLVIVLSSLMINKVAHVHYDFIDKVFTVYDREHENTVNINCDKRHCFTCRRCYKKTAEIEYINEKLK